ncbi:MAG: hypothetical protein ABSH06_32415, partial [Thermodesulfobacteriota bacterium]
KPFRTWKERGISVNFQLRPSVSSDHSIVARVQRTGHKTPYRLAQPRDASNRPESGLWVIPIVIPL